MQLNEGLDDLQMTWDVWPRSEEEARSWVIPLAASITLLRPHPSIPILPYHPLCCKNCNSILNPFSCVENNQWVCCFCNNKNEISISLINLPEINSENTTVEYKIPRQQNAPCPVPIFMFVVDTCMMDENISKALKGAANSLPEKARVGFISFGKEILVHSQTSKSCVFRGKEGFTTEQVLNDLELEVYGWVNTLLNFTNWDTERTIVSKFLMRASDFKTAIDTLLEEIQTVHWPVPDGNRSSRRTGHALTVAAGLLGGCYPGTRARIIALVGGPCTEGPGMIVSTDLSDPVRSHNDLNRNAAPYFKKAVKFYENLANQLVRQGHVLDLFASALDQVGIAEMKVAVEKTGGLVVLAESFDSSVFKNSFKHVFEGGEQSLGLCFNGTLDINCSKDVKIQGIIGPCTSLEKKGPAVADTTIGEGGTTQWKMCGLDKSTCLTVFFDVSSSDQSNTPGTVNPQLYLQFCTSYQNHEGQLMLRVTTITRGWIDSDVSLEELLERLDYETATVIIARMISLKMEMEEGFDATQRLDESLLRLCTKLNPRQCLKPNFSFFLYHQFFLLRSPFVRVFNQSPDVTAYFRMMLNRETIINAIKMIVPLLTSYNTNNSEGDPVLLEADAINPDCTLLMDSFFTVVVLHGTEIAQGRDGGEHLQFCQNCLDDARKIIENRFPVPKMVICDQNESEARFLLVKLMPSGSDSDVNYEGFLEGLCRAALQ